MILQWTLTLIFLCSFWLLTAQSDRQEEDIDEMLEMCNEIMLSNPDSTYHLADIAFQKSHRREYGYGKFRSSLFKAYYYDFDLEGHHDKAVINYLHAIEALKDFDISRGSDLHSIPYNNSAIIFEDFKSYELAFEFYGKGLAIAKSRSDTLLMSTIENNLISATTRLGNYAKALELAEGLYKFMTENTVEEEIDLYYRWLYHMIHIHYGLLNFDSAIYYSKKVLYEFPDENNEDAYLDIALCFHKLNRRDSAEFYYQSSLQDYHLNDLSDESKKHLVETSIHFARFYMEAEEYRHAERILLKAIKVSELLGQDLKILDDYFEIYQLLSELYNHLGKLDEAKDYQKLYKIELNRYTELHKRYDMDEIVQDFYDNLEQQEQEEERDRKLKLYASVASGGFLFVLALTFGVNRYQRYRTQKKLAKTTTEKRLAELKALKAQINPHFLFNALNSIQSYILEDQHQVAEEYLVKYGQLMRKILDHSNELTVPLNEELEALQLYVELEQLRVSQSFDYKVTVDEAIDPYNTLVPSMVIQPFIENAIWHGVSQLTDRDGLIELTITEKDNLLEVQIKDNGVGYDTSQPSSTSSKGVNLVRERLELLKETGGEDSVLEVRSVPGRGTEVTLRFSAAID